ncbi:MAG: prephenate dehydrogenase, partial [Chloroflexota bacterium]
MSLHGSCRRVVGVARRSEVAQQALDMGIVDAASTDLRAVAEADIVVLATPVRHILATIPELAAVMRPGALLLDLGSTKSQVVAAMNALPVALAAVGGHPMCGKETGGLESADANLYRGATFVLMPTERTTDAAMLLAHEMVEAIGAVPLVMDAERHDRAVASVSHLPYLLAASLMHVGIEAEATDVATGRLAASGFRDTTRLAASSLDMMLDTLLTNREPLLAALDIFEEKIAQVRGLLDDPVGLKAWMAEAQCRRREMFR